MINNSHLTQTYNLTDKEFEKMILDDDEEGKPLKKGKKVAKEESEDSGDEVGYTVTV